MHPDIEHIVTLLLESPVKLGLFTASIASIGYVLSRRFNNSSKIPAPPGPPRQFLIGNLLQFPREHMHETFSEWQKTYGDIVSVELLGIPIVVLNSYNLAHDLLSKRPNTTSAREIPYMIREVMGWRWSLAIIQPGPSHTAQRKMLRRGIGPQRVGSHDPRIESSTNRLMLTFQTLQGNPCPIILRAMGQVVIEVAYGKKVFLSLPGLSSWNIESMELISPTFNTFRLVDAFHFLHFVPSWFPGAKFRRIGDRSTWLADQIRNAPYSKAHELYESGEIGHSLATDLLDEFGPNDDARDALGILYLTGAETTTSAIVAFLHALYLFPEVSQKVYNEIVAVTDGARMPKIANRPQMPYSEAVWMECFRWNTFVPVGVPHVNTQDEIVNGFLIKAGTQIFPNSWSMMMDKNIWGDPENFRPERFLEPDAGSLPSPLVIAFGYGMRVCPGMYLADRIGFHVATTTAALYEIAPLEGRNRPKPESVKYTEGLLTLPVGFECRFLPRGQRSQELLKTISLLE